MTVIWVLDGTKLTGLAQKIVILWHLVADSSVTSCFCSWCWMHLCSANEQGLEQLCV